MSMTEAAMLVIIFFTTFNWPGEIIGRAVEGLMYLFETAFGPGRR